MSVEAVESAVPMKISNGNIQRVDTESSSDWGDQHVCDRRQCYFYVGWCCRNSPRNEQQPLSSHMGGPFCQLGENRDSAEGGKPLGWLLRVFLVLRFPMIILEKPLVEKTQQTECSKYRRPCIIPFPMNVFYEVGVILEDCLYNGNASTKEGYVKKTNPKASIIWIIYCKKSANDRINKKLKCKASLVNGSQFTYGVLN
jgi:hypothetical protein